MAHEQRRDDPDLERGRAAADAVRAAGGSAMDAAIAAIRTAFDQTARDRTLAERQERIAAFRARSAA